MNIIIYEQAIVIDVDINVAQIFRILSVSGVEILNFVNNLVFGIIPVTHSHI